MSEHKELPIIAFIRLVLGSRELTKCNKEDFKFGLMNILQIGEYFVNVLMISVGLFQQIREIDKVTPLIKIVVELNSQTQQRLQ